jgi:paraquat-inducible protein A
LDARGAGLIALVVLTVLIALPAARLSCWIAVLAAARAPRPPRWAALLLRAVRTLSPWAMIEVFLLGSLVAHGRLAALGSVDVGPSFVALAATVLVTAAIDAGVDREALWRALGPSALPRSGASAVVATAGTGAWGLSPRAELAGWIGCAGCDRVSRARSGDRCPRCGATLHARKPDSVTRTWALVIAAALLYLPSNLLPVLSLVRLGKLGPRTILGGVIELAQANLWGLAAIVFVASLVIPLLKLISLVTMLLMTHRRSARGLVGRTRLLRFVDTVGRWSMVDIFVLTTLVALVRVPFFATVLPENGATAFAAVVVLTMLAAGAFDPRLMWDAPVRPGEAR